VTGLGVSCPNGSTATTDDVMTTRLIFGNFAAEESRVVVPDTAGSIISACGSSD
jgi:hypothetical protein